MPLEEVSYKDLKLNPMTLFGEEWAALAARTSTSPLQAHDLQNAWTSARRS